MAAFPSSAPSLTLPRSSPSFCLKLPTRLAHERGTLPAWVSELTPLKRVCRIFGSDPSSPVLALLRGRHARVILAKNARIEPFSRQGSHELFGHRPGAGFMKSSPLPASWGRPASTAGSSEKNGLLSAGDAPGWGQKS